MAAAAAPIPAHLLRSHSAPLGALCFSDDNERLYSGDGSGFVVVTSTRSLRAITAWKAHTDGLLGVEEWGARIITHARDNKLHVWTRIEELPASTRLGGSAAQPNLPIPALCYSMDVNALNYCRFSLRKLPLPRTEGSSAPEEQDALIALPNLVDSAVADVWSLPSCQRLHAAIGQTGKKSVFSSDPQERNPTGIIMSLHLYSVPKESPQSSAPSEPSDELRLLCAYENGSVALRRYARADKPTSVEGAGWEVIWNVKLHVESIMAMKVSRTNDLALTVSADHLIGRCDLSRTDAAPSTACVAHRTKHPGNSTVAIRDDGRICAVGGWDGKIRLYATRTLKPLGSLKYHKTACQIVDFARSADTAKVSSAVGELLGEDEDDEDEMSEDEKADRARWLVGGGKDNRVSIWSLMSFEKKR